MKKDYIFAIGFLLFSIGASGIDSTEIWRLIFEATTLAGLGLMYLGGCANGKESQQQVSNKKRQQVHSEGITGRKVQYMSTGTVEKPITEKNQDFAALMEEVATLEPQQQEKLTFFVQGYVAAAAAINERNKAAI